MDFTKLPVFAEADVVVCGGGTAGAFAAKAAADQGRDVLIPDVPEFIKEISEEGGMLVLPIPGLFDEADEV